MNVITFVHEGLGNSSYLIALGNGGAAVIDPDRSIKRYLDTASARSLRSRRRLKKAPRDRRGEPP